LLTGFHLVELLGTERFPVIKVLVPLHRRFRQNQVGIRCDELLLCSHNGCGRTIYSGLRLRVVDYGEHLTSPHAVPFVSPDLDDISHQLTREFAGLGSTHGSCSLQEIGDLSWLHREHGNVPDSFWGLRLH
jgi:hypothetical protein